MEREVKMVIMRSGSTGAYPGHVTTKDAILDWKKRYDAGETKMPYLKYRGFVVGEIKNIEVAEDKDNEIYLTATAKVDLMEEVCFKRG